MLGTSIYDYIGEPDRNLMDRLLSRQDSVNSTAVRLRGARQPLRITGKDFLARKSQAKSIQSTFFLGLVEETTLCDGPLESVFPFAQFRVTATLEFISTMDLKTLWTDSR